MRLLKTRWNAVLAALLLGAAGILAAAPAEAGPAAVEAAEGGTDSEVTVTGRPGKYDDFSGLSITVSQTRELTGQGIVVTWRGAKPTPRNRLGANFLQFMQCWGPDPEAPDFRETCQYGVEATLPSWGDEGPAGDLTGRAPAHHDPDESLPNDAKMVPFKAVNGERTPHGGAANPFPSGTNDNRTVLAPFFNLYTTNEVPAVISTADGTGRFVFEAQTAVQAPHLGCGQKEANGTGQRCWLVVVPRGDHDPYTGADLSSTGGPVSGSPLAPALFANRIVIPLDFQPIGQFCPIGQRERRTVGSELMAEAITSWQPALCADGGPVFGYAQTGDDEAGRQVTSPSSGAPGLAFTADPVPAPADRPVVQAPVALSAAVIAFNVDVRTDGSAPPEIEALRATAVRDLKLTPRLVAKLLTQSYRRDAPGGQVPSPDCAAVPKPAACYLAPNPRTLREDKEFLEHNPLFQYFSTVGGPDGMMVSIGNFAAAREVWRWVLADDAARAWLGGQPDEHGMVANPNYVSLLAGGVPPTNFPKADPSCHQPVETGATIPYCTLDLRPYLNSLHEAANQVLRADARVRITWNPVPDTPPARYVASPPQPVSQRFALSITDSASAARYGLFTASLRNRAGEFVAPTDAALLAARGGMVPTGVPDVLRPDPTKSVPGAYPLAMLTYAAVDTTEPADVRRDYAALLRYAAGPGQSPGLLRGQLPPGYVPLPEDLRARTRAAADAVERAKQPTTAVATTTTPPTTTGGGNPPPQTLPPVIRSTATVRVTPTRSATPSTTRAPVPVAEYTKAQSTGVVRYALVGAFALGGVAALFGPALGRILGRREDGAP